MKINYITLPATDLLVVGGGAASLWATLTAQEHAPKRKVRGHTKARSFAERTGAPISVPIVLPPFPTGTATYIIP